MLNENAKKWIEELRSGRWKQHRRSLANADRTAFCGLGVACELAVKAAIIAPPVMLHGISFYGRSHAILPDSVTEWMGLRTHGGYVKLNGQWTSLGDLNDAGWSFDELADFIESEPPGLFGE